MAGSSIPESTGVTFLGVMLHICNNRTTSRHGSITLLIWQQFYKKVIQKSTGECRITASLATLLDAYEIKLRSNENYKPISNREKVEIHDDKIMMIFLVFSDLIEALLVESKLYAAILYVKCLKKFLVPSDPQLFAVKPWLFKAWLKVKDVLLDKNRPVQLLTDVCYLQKRELPKKTKQAAARLPPEKWTTVLTQHVRTETPCVDPQQSCDTKSIVLSFILDGMSEKLSREMVSRIQNLFGIKTISKDCVFALLRDVGEMQSSYLLTCYDYCLEGSKISTQNSYKSIYYAVLETTKCVRSEERYVDTIVIQILKILTSFHQSTIYYDNLITSCLLLRDITIKLVQNRELDQALRVLRISLQEVFLHKNKAGCITAAWRGMLDNETDLRQKSTFERLDEIKVLLPLKQNMSPPVPERAKRQRTENATIKIILHKKQKMLPSVQACTTSEPTSSVETTIPCSEDVLTTEQGENDLIKDMEDIREIVTAYPESQRLVEKELGLENQPGLYEQIFGPEDNQGISNNDNFDCENDINPEEEKKLLDSLFEIYFSKDV